MAVNNLYAAKEPVSAVFRVCIANLKQFDIGRIASKTLE